MKKKPHIVIFNPDEMRGDAMHHPGNVMPFLESMTREDAVAFDRAYCQNPVCVPSRCSFFTGLYPHVAGHRTMSHLLQPGETTLLKELKDSGYYVWMNDRNDLTAGQIPGWTESHADEIYYSGQVKKAPGPVDPTIRGKRGSKFFYSHYEGELRLDEDGRNYNSDDEVVDAAIDRILHPVDDRPMCLFLGLMFPHTPYRAEEPYFSAIDRETIAPRVRWEECTGRPRIEALIRQYQALDGMTEEDWAALRGVYYGMCRKVDDQFKRLVMALKDAGIYEDCAIFFLSDHGDYTGDYGLAEKAQNSFPECLSRVPLLIKPPKGVDFTPGTTDTLTELVDFYATALDFAGIPASHTHFGHSLRTQLADHDLEHRKYAFCEGGRAPGESHCDEYHDGTGKDPSPMVVYWPKKMAQTDDEAHAKGIMMVSKRYKYVSRILGSDEFYDLERDPQEKHNVIGDPQYAPVLAEMRMDMLKWLQGTADIVPFRHDQRFTPEMMWARARALVAPVYAAEARRLIDEGADFTHLMEFCRSHQ